MPKGKAPYKSNTISSNNGFTSDFRNAKYNKESVEYTNEKYGKSETPSSAVAKDRVTPMDTNMSADSETARQNRLGDKVTKSSPQDAKFFKHTIKGK